MQSRHLWKQRLRNWKSDIRMKKQKLLQNMWQSRVQAVMERKHERGRMYGKDYYVRII